MTTADAPLQGRTVLIVEDQYLIAEELRAIVERLGGSVVGPLPRVPAALTTLEATFPDLALLDVNVNGQPIYEVAAVLRSRGIPFALVTGYDRSAIAPEFRDAPYIEKPVAESAIINLLSQWGHR
ncbi:response regulator [Plastoroseomonas hellenica]|uniref:response regulator n=1 Tax=Plastoroseomonas hellenica TaxID=2687306 RepID=UPI001BA71AA4|nr:response regulator [Plastoroseomonas hellenica]MBR0645397.1 response regulator [Plastoroseomonas hellenica]